MDTDTSNFAIRAVLSKHFEDGRLHPTALLSKENLPGRINQRNSKQTIGFNRNAIQGMEVIPQRSQTQYSD